MPTGIWSDGDTIWVANFKFGLVDKLYAYDLYKGTRLADLDLDLDSGNTAPRGIWSTATPSGWPTSSTKSSTPTRCQSSRPYPSERWPRRLCTSLG